MIHCLNQIYYQMSINLWAGDSSGVAECPGGIQKTSEARVTATSGVTIIMSKQTPAVETTRRMRSLMAWKEECPVLDRTGVEGYLRKKQCLLFWGVFI